MKVVLTFIFLFFYGGGSVVHASQMDEGCPVRTNVNIGNSKSVSMINLITSPEKYYGRMINIKGLLDIDGRLPIVYFDKRSEKNIITKEAVFITDPKINADLEILNKLDGEFVVVNGIFEKPDYSKFIGEFKKVQLLCLNYQAPKRMPLLELKKQ
ncbi:hypothetical protein [Gallaecimonas sp. GXIMD1310]|uniref:hypothetical protein n=1 Tax=Gallaecimonas sp. GXIMD1310 TaxID=3131926 RepID=UPI003250B940